MPQQEYQQSKDCRKLEPFSYRDFFANPKG